MAGSHFTVTRIGDARVIELTPTELTDAAFIREVGDEIYRVVGPLEAPKVVVDFGRVERLSSAALGMLVALDKVVVGKRNGQLRIARVADNLKDIFRMTKLDKVLRLCDDARTAADSFS